MMEGTSDLALLNFLARGDPINFTGSGGSGEIQSNPTRDILS